MYVFFKSCFALLGGKVLGVGFAVEKFLFVGHIAAFFQIFEMAGQVAVCYFQQALEGVEVQVVVDHEGRHDAQPGFVFKRFI